MDNLMSIAKIALVKEESQYWLPNKRKRCFGLYVHCQHHGWQVQFAILVEASNVGLLAGEWAVLDVLPHGARSWLSRDVSMSKRQGCPYDAVVQRTFVPLPATEATLAIACRSYDCLAILERRRRTNLKRSAAAC